MRSSNVFYMQTVGNKLIHCYEKRKLTISDWTARDESIDERIAKARLSDEPYCQYCGKQGLRIIDRSLMHRGESYDIDGLKGVFIFRTARKTSQFISIWEDGTAWKVDPTICPKCNPDITHKPSKTKKATVITYMCTSCKHSFKDRTGLFSSREEEPDPQLGKEMQERV